MPSQQRGNPSPYPTSNKAFDLKSNHTTGSNQNGGQRRANEYTKAASNEHVQQQTAQAFMNNLQGVGVSKSPIRDSY